MSQGLNILVTGATGFIGSALCRQLHQSHPDVQVYSTTYRAKDGEVLSIYPAGEAHAAPAFPLPTIDVVVHLAARVHLMRDSSANPLDEFRAANVGLTHRLASWAAAQGARRFILMSSTKVNGEATEPRQAFSANDAPAPQDAYAVSKLEAEHAVQAICAETGMEYVIIRPPLVYGPGVKANFGALVRWVRRGLPLPLASIDNRRSLVALDNLVDFLIRCLSHPAAANQTFMVSDGKAISTSELLRRIADAYGMRARLIPFPPKWLEFVACCLGKPGIAERLLGSLVVDDRKAQDCLGWKPVVSMDEQLKKMAENDTRP